MGADSVRVFLDGLPLRQSMVLLPPIVEALAGSALFSCPVSVITLGNKKLEVPNSKIDDASGCVCKRLVLNRLGASSYGRPSME